MRNSSYSFIPILLKLYRCLHHALKIYTWFGYNPQINFCHLFLQFELSHFSGIFTMKVNGQWVHCVRNSSYSFIPILLKLYRCCDHALKICMWFGYNPQINFCYFLPFFGHFHNESEWAAGTLCAQLLLQFHANSSKTLHVLWAWSENMHVVWI